MWGPSIGEAGRPLAAVAIEQSLHAGARSPTDGVWHRCLGSTPAQTNRLAQSVDEFAAGWALFAVPLDLVARRCVQLAVEISGDIRQDRATG
jgi:hypothetical protein